MSRGANQAHIALHSRLKALDRIDSARTYSQAIRNLGAELTRRIDIAAGPNAVSMEPPELENEGKRCFYAPDTEVFVQIEVYREADVWNNLGDF